jgi:nucleosome assembly protein 1-like 1
LEGQTSSYGYLDDQPAEVKRRIRALKFHDLKKEDLNKLYFEELSALRKKYMNLRQPILSEMAAIIQGNREPTEDETVLDDEDEGSDRIEEVESSAARVKGVPDFWLHVLKNSPLIGDLITEADEAALKHLQNIEVVSLDPHGFQINFQFAPNEFFSNAVLSKSYFFRESSDDADGDELEGGRSEGTQIDWKDKNDLTVKVEMKTQKKKGSKEVRTVRKEVPCESFFHIFNPPLMPDEDTEDDDELYEAIEADFQIGELLKNRIIPRALDCYLGEMSDLEDEDCCDEEDCEGCDEEDEDDEDEDEDEEEERSSRMKEEIDDDDDDDDDEEQIPSKSRSNSARKAGSKQQAQYDNSACKQQ